MNPYSLLWIIGAGLFNGIMDSIKHHPWVWDWLGDGKLYHWMMGNKKIGKGKCWMQGPLYIIMDGWHSAKQFMVICFLMSATVQLPERWRWYGFGFMVLAWGIGFNLMYKGILGGAEMIRM